MALPNPLALPPILLPPSPISLFLESTTIGNCVIASLNARVVCLAPSRRPDHDNESEERDRGGLPDKENAQWP